MASMDTRVPSPSQSRHVFMFPAEDNKRRAQSPSFSHRDKRSSTHQRRSSLEPVLESDSKHYAIGGRGTPSDVAPRSQPRPNLSKQRVFSTTDASCRLRVANSSRNRDFDENPGSFVFAEVKTNVMVRLPVV